MKESIFSTTEQKIKETFLQLYIKKDITNISVKEICDKVPMSRTNFYNYYDNVFSVYESIENTVLADLDNISIDFDKSDFRHNTASDLKGIDELLEYIRKNSLCFKVLIKHSGTNGFLYKWKRQIKEKFYKKYQKETVHRAEREVYLEFTVSGITGLCEYWLYHPDLISKQEIIEGVYTMVCHEKLR